MVLSGFGAILGRIAWRTTTFGAVLVGLRAVSCLWEAALGAYDRREAVRG